jgi:hypothetical protein
MNGTEFHRNISKSCRPAAIFRPVFHSFPSSDSLPCVLFPLRSISQLRKADDAKVANKFGSCLERGQGFEQDIAEALLYYHKAASLSDRDGLKGIDQDYTRAAKYYRLSADQNHSSAQDSFGIFLECGICVQPNQALAVQFYRRSAFQGHPDGGCSGVKQNIELTAQYDKFATDLGHPEGHPDGQGIWGFKRRNTGRGEDRSGKLTRHDPMPRVSRRG